MSTGIMFGLFILVVICGLGIYNFICLGKEKKIDNIKEWLKYAVIEAEKYFGGGTGQIKLRYVYDLAVTQFPWIVTLVSFETFSGWVDEALIWMKEQIEQNIKIDGYVQGGDRA